MKPPANTVEIQILNKQDTEKSNKEEKQIVRDVNLPENQMDDNKTKARFLSENRQRVLVETQAKNVGLSRNQDPYRPQPKWQTPKKFNAVDELKNYEAVPMIKPQPQTQPDSPSTVGETLPKDVTIGSFTALNTDRFTYYSFYARIEELIRYRWESRVRAAVETFDRHYLSTVVGQRNWITQAEFLLTKEGRLHSVLIMKESGIRKFDQAVIGAFREANIFPNPPQEMIEDDGFIHIKYSFNVYYEPSLMASSK